MKLIVRTQNKIKRKGGRGISIISHSEEKTYRISFFETKALERQYVPSIWVYMSEC